MFRRMARAGAVLALAGLAAGCVRETEAGPKLTGRVVMSGQPVRPVSVLDFDVMFLSVGGEGPLRKSYVAAVDEDGSLVVNGSIGKGIPVGRYKVVVRGAVLDATGRPNRKYQTGLTEQATPLEIEITESSKELTIDLEKKTATLS